MNTHPSRIHALETIGEKIILDSEHFFTMANMMDDQLYIHLIQRDTHQYDIQDMEEEITERLWLTKKRARKVQMWRMRRKVEIQAKKGKQL